MKYFSVLKGIAGPESRISPNEKIYGCGESATALNKAGQKVNLFVKT